MEVFLAIAVAAVAIATLVVALSFRKRTEKQVSALLERSRDTAAPNDETAVNELRAQLYAGLARLDQLSVGLQTVQEYRPAVLSPPERGRAMSVRSGRDDAEPMDVAAAVASFHQAFRRPVRRQPSAEIDPALARLRVDLIQEEVSEFVAASQQGDLVGIADALADIVYVVYGTALTYGIDLDAVLAEVHRSNMSKLGRDGKPVLREDGKVLKSDRYVPPDIAAALGLPGAE
jgi:predicted HAD superfamily Cof-like phosphohydrolase